MKNLFITIEGCDGAGKSTIVNHIYEYIQSKNLDVIKTREPGGSYVAEKFRNIIVNNNIQPETEVLTFAAARIEHIEEVIKPAFNKNKVVICDRYFDSSIIYQGYARGLDIENIKNINAMAINEFSPTLTIVLDVDVNIAQTRIKRNERKINRFDNETIEFHKKCHEGFKKLRQIFPERNIKYINASKDEKTVKKNVFKLIDEVLNDT